MRALFEITRLLNLRFEWIGCREKCAMPVAMVITETPVVPTDAVTHALLQAMAAGVAFSTSSSRACIEPDNIPNSPQPPHANDLQSTPARELPKVFMEGSRVRITNVGRTANHFNKDGDDLVEAMARQVAKELLQLDVGHVMNAKDVRCVLEDYRISAQMMKAYTYKGKVQPDRIHGRVGNCEQLMKLYEELIANVIGPHLVAEFEKECPTGVEVESDSRTILYQYPPTVRIYPSNALVPLSEGESLTSDLKQQSQLRTLTRMHTDREFGHQDGEINFWMPFTGIDESSTLWAETRPNRGDWYPFFPLDVGEAWRFPGTSCRHFTKPNTSGKTRVSLDFRCSVASCYDEKWKMWGNSNRHAMRSMIIS